MTVIARGNFLFRGSNGENFLLKGGVLTSDLPSWVTESEFFSALCREGRIAISDSTKDAKVQKAIEDAEIKEEVVKAEKEQKAVKKSTAKKTTTKK